MSLLHGWLPWAVQAAAAAVLLAGTGWRNRTWRMRLVPLVLAVGAAGTGAAMLAVQTTVREPLPASFWIWVGACLCAAGVAALGWRGARWWRRTVAALAVVLTALAAGVRLNEFVGYYPTVGDALADLRGQPLPGQVNVAQLPAVGGGVRAGRLVTVDIPDTASHFRHRQELVYLPPVWFNAVKRPKLPVLEMIGGEYAEPTNWVRAGNAVQTADVFAAQHGGWAPILVFVDATGGFRVDTECVNGLAGPAQDHLTKDIPPFVAATFGASPDPRNWGVVGWSMGGTCAITLAVTHPEVFDHFEDISGDLGPNIGDRASTIAKLYGGNAAAWAANDPLTVMRAHGPYRNVSGWFEQGDAEASHIRQANQLAAAAARVGILTHEQQRPGKHDWQLGSAAFADALPWLAQQLGLPGVTPTPPAVPPSAVPPAAHGRTVLGQPAGPDARPPGALRPPIARPHLRRF
ncbi:alpha/beta hydrolase [Gandjariella thermophila]|uniref:Membrane protein n=1 Tax=Gandjariella thermophila TaxID=1931992 RepID=A0A4D4IZY3_9PSEU|nr:alpha/beta hydrolase-fold protein [Gandjariella thermophila]GDY29801.1 membrane protein [Gandjariella thermophila]